MCLTTSFSCDMLRDIIWDRLGTPLWIISFPPPPSPVFFSASFPVSVSWPPAGSSRVPVWFLFLDNEDSRSHLRWDALAPVHEICHSCTRTYACLMWGMADGLHKTEYLARNVAAESEEESSAILARCAWKCVSPSRSKLQWLGMWTWLPENSTWGWRVICIFLSRREYQWWISCLPTRKSREPSCAEWKCKRKIMSFFHVEEVTQQGK